MKAKFLKIAKCKTVKQFYDKYPTEKAFFEAHPEAKTSIKKAQIGAYIGGGANPNAEMINFQDVYDVAEKQAVGSTSSEREEAAYKQQMLEALKAKGGGGEGGAQSSGMDMGSVMGMMGGGEGGEGGGLMNMIGGEGGGIGGGSEGGGGLMEMLGGLFGGGGMRYGGNVPKAYGGTNVNNWWSNMTTTAQTTGAPGGFDINTYGIGAQTMGRMGGTPATQGTPPDTSNPNWMNKNTSGAPYEASQVNKNYTGYEGEISQDDGIASKLGGLTKLAGPVGALIEGVDALKGEKEAAARAKQLRMLTDLQLTASQTRPEEKERRYVRPEDVVNTGEAFFPIYGVGTNALARNGIRLQGGGMIKGNPTEIQNTYGNGRSIYDDLGYVPLIDEDQDKNFRYGGYIPRAQNGMQNYMSTMGGGGSGFSGAGSGGTPWGAIGSFGSQAANTVQGGGNAGGSIGGTVLGSIGAIFGPAGQAIGQVVGTVAGNELDPYAGPMKLDTAKNKRNVENIAYNKTAPEIQAAHEAHVRDGGKISQAQRGKKIKIKDDRLDRQVTKDQLQDRNVFSQNQLSFKKPVVQKQMKQLRKDAANPKVVVFAESPRDKPTYDPYDSNLPKGLINLRDEYFDNENKIDSIRMTDKTYKNLLDKVNNIEGQAYDLQMKYGPDDPRVQKAYEKGRQINDQFNQYTFGNKAFNKKLKPYRDMADSSYVRFRDSELNPMAMDSTFYKEAQNVKDFYKRTDPNTKVDVVPLYGDDKLMQRKLRDMSQFDKFAIFGHSGDKLAGIKNNDIAKYLSDSRVNDCYFGSCGFEGQIENSDLKDMQGKNLNYRPSGNLWLGFNPAAKTFDEGMWSRQLGGEDGPTISPIKPGVSHITNKLEDGGYMNPEYNPQVITMFGDHNAQDFADYAHKYRAGGHLQSYTPPSDRAMETYKDGGEVRRSALNGEVQTTWGGGIKTLSHNPYMPATGETIEFVGNSHDKYDPKSKQTGIGVKYGQGSQDSYTDYAEYGTDQADANVEVEKEPAAELIDPNTGEKNLTIYGNLRIPDKYVDLLGDPKAKGMKFKHYIAKKSKEEDKINRMIDTSTDQLNALDVKTSGDRLTLAALEAKIKGGNMKLKDIADIKITSAGIQDAYNKTAEEYGIVADDLARGKVTFDKKATAEYARYGKSIPKAQDGKKEKFKSEKAALDAGYIKDNSGYYKILPPEKLDPIETKDAAAMDNIPKQSIDKVTGLYGGVTAAQFEEFKKKNQWYPKFKDNTFDQNNPEHVDDLAKAFNAEAEKRGSKARILPDKDASGKTTKVGKQVVSADLSGTKKVQPAVGRREEAEIEEAPNTKPVPYKRSALIDIANQALDYIRPTDQEPFDYGQAMGEMYALSNNQVEPVQAQMYKPELRIPYDISYQDVLNENQADFNATIKQLGYNPAAQPMVNANKYMANQRVLADQFRANQAMKDQVYSGNINTLNQAKLANLDIFDKQYERQALAKSNTKATTQAALNSLDDKIAKHKLENKTLGIYENLYKYRYDKNGRAINMNGIFQPNIGTVGSTAGTQKQVPIYGPDGKTITGYQLQEMTPEEIALQETNNSGAIPSLATLPINNNAKTKTTKNSRNGSIVKAIKNL